MTKKHSTKKALIAGVLMLALCFSMLIGTTFAWFTDSVTSANNIIKTGNLDIGVYYATPEDVVNGDIPAENWKPLTEAPIFNQNALWEPGYTEVLFFKFANEGSLALQYQFKVDILNEVIGMTESGEKIQLSKYINTYICNNFLFNYREFLFTDRDSATNPAGAPSPYCTTLYEAANMGMNRADNYLENQLSLDSWQWLDPSETTYATMVLWMPTNVGNEANHNGSIIPNINLGISVLATQYTYEKDSFGKDYDEAATFPGFNSADKETNESIAIADKDIKIDVPANAPAGNYAIEVSNKSEFTDEDGNTTIAMDITLKKDGVKVEEIDGIQHKISINVGKGMNIVGITHNGTAISNYEYSGLTGIVEFYTSSFSPFTISYSVPEGLNPDAEYLAGGRDFHSSTTESGIFQLTSDIKTSSNGDDARYGYGYEYIIRKQADYTLDLNGKTLIHDTVNANANKNAFTYTLVANNAGTKLTIEGSGKIISHNSEGYTCTVQGKDGTLITINGGEFNTINGITVWAGAGAHIVINDGSFVNSGATTDHELIYSSGGVIDIYGGFFHNTDGHRVLNIEDRNRATGFINVYGGTFVNFDPTTGGQDPNNIKLAEGYTVVSETQENGDVWYTVVPLES